MEQLCKMRVDHELTQLQVANYLGVSRTTYVKYETGNIALPLQNAIKLSVLYGVSLEALLGIEECSTNSSNERLSESEQQLLRLFRSLSAQGQDYIFQQLNIALQVYTKNASLPIAGTEAG